MPHGKIGWKALTTPAPNNPPIGSTSPVANAITNGVYTFYAVKQLDFGTASVIQGVNPISNLNLQLIYNKARQSAITQEISEIVAGADAV